MKRVWSASVFCQFEHRIAFGKRADTGVWEPVTTRVKRTESPAEAAVRVVEEQLGLDIHFPPIHQLMGAPQGLVLYHEYPISVEETRQSFLFLGEVDTDAVKLKGDYCEVMWTHSDQKLPNTLLPQVRAAFPFALMAAGLVRTT